MKSPTAEDHFHMNWDTEEFNYGIIYHNGIITVDESGFYRITASCYANANRRNSVKLQTFVNNNVYLATVSASAPGFSYGIIYLEMFDTIHFEKTGSFALADGTSQNYFTIEKIYDKYGFKNGKA